MLELLKILLPQVIQSVSAFGLLNPKNKLWKRCSIVLFIISALFSLTTSIENWKFRNELVSDKTGWVSVGIWDDGLEKYVYGGQPPYKTYLTGFDSDFEKGELVSVDTKKLNLRREHPKSCSGFDSWVDSRGHDTLSEDTDLEVMDRYEILDCPWTDFRRVLAKVRPIKPSLNHRL